MESKLFKIQELLRRRADINSRLALIPYDGSPEVKTRGDKKYLYVRKRVGSRNTSTYVDTYSDELFNQLLLSNKLARELKKDLRQIDRELAELGYQGSSLSPSVLLNLEYARANLKSNIYDQAVLEGVGATFPQTEEIIENGVVNGVAATDVQKILNLKHAWEFILDEDVLQSETDYYIICHIAKIVNEGFFVEGGRIRGVPVSIGGSSYKPEIPSEPDVKDEIKRIVGEEEDDVKKATHLLLYLMRSQVFLDGNKRAAVIAANHFLISKGAGMLIIPEELVPEFRKLLIDYYETNDEKKISKFILEHCVSSCLGD